MSGEYSREQIEKMQKDAERRVMEMQRRSKGAMEKEGASFGRQPVIGQSVGKAIGQPLFGRTKLRRPQFLTPHF